MVKGSRVYKSANNNDHPRSRDAALDISADLQAVMDGVDAKERGMSALQVPLSEAWYHKRKVLVIVSLQRPGPTLARPLTLTRCLPSKRS